MKYILSNFQSYINLKHIFFENFYNRMYIQMKTTFPINTIQSHANKVSLCHLKIVFNLK